MWDKVPGSAPLLRRHARDRGTFHAIRSTWHVGTCIPTETNCTSGVAHFNTHVLLLQSETCSGWLRSERRQLINACVNPSTKERKKHHVTSKQCGEGTACWPVGTPLRSNAGTQLHVPLPQTCPSPPRPRITLQKGDDHPVCPHRKRRRPLRYSFLVEEEVAAAAFHVIVMKRDEVQQSQTL